MSLLPNLADILESISSDTVRERENGFSRLKSALELQQKRGGISDLKDRHVHHIFETIFAAISKERITYVQATKPTTKNTASTRLSTFASVLRSTVAVLLSRLRLKTLRAFLGHVVHALPVPEEGLCRPLCGAYVKALRAILEYPPHVEHLSLDDWSSTVDFCINSLTVLDAESSQSSLSTSEAAGTPRGSFLISQRASMKTTSDSPASLPGQGRDSTYGLIHCLAALVGASNCQIEARCQQIIRTICCFLEGATSITSAHTAAYTCINRVLERIRLSRSRQIVEIFCAVAPCLQLAWSAREAALRDQILIFLILSDEFLSKLSLRSIGDESNLVDQVRRLHDTLKTDYLDTDKRDRRKLNMQDISLRTSDLDTPSGAPGLQTIRLRHAMTSAEHSWAILQALGALSSWLDSGGRFGQESATQRHNSQRKRHRTESQCAADILGNIKRLHTLDPTYAIQILTFMLPRQSFTATDSLSIVKTLTPLVISPDKVVACWAMVALAECTAKPEFRSKLFSAIWIEIWHSAWKLMSSSPYCRASCHLLRLMITAAMVPQDCITASLANLQNSTSLHGPAQVSDSSVALWQAISEISRQKSAPVSFDEDAFTEWLCNHWQPNNYENRSAAQQIAAHVNAKDIILAMNIILGTRLDATESFDINICGDVQQANLAVRNTASLARYLIEHQAVSTDLQRSSLSKLSGTARATAITRHEQRLLNYFLAESEKLCESPLASDESPMAPAAFNASMAHVITTFAVTGLIACGHFSVNYPESAARLVARLDRLSKCLATYVAKLETPQATVEAMLQAMLPVLPDLKSEVPVDVVLTTGRVLQGICTKLSNGMLDRQKLEDISRTHNDLEDDDIMPYSNSQQIQRRGPASGSSQHSIQIVHTSSLAFYSSIVAYLRLVATANFTQVEERGQQVIISSDFIDSLLDVSLPEFLASKPFLGKLVNSSWLMKESDATRLLEHMMDTFLQEHDYERSEVSIDLCLELMRGFLSLWASAPDTKIGDYAADLYDWFTEKCAACSSRVQYSFSQLLFELLPTPFEGKQSVRTALLNVLSESDLVVQYDISERLPAIFGLYTLHVHEEIFRDVVLSLPKDTESIEGIAIRLHALCKMASSWKTLLRLCVFHIFEVAGKVVDSLPYARTCFQQVAESYELSSPTELFDMFLPQLVFTWIDHRSGSLAQIPFQVFGFDDFKDLLRHVSCEVISQSYMGHGGHEFQDEMSNGLGQSLTELTVTCFPKVLAYSLSQDAVTRTESGSSSHICEGRVCNTLSAEKVTSLLFELFPDVIGQVLSRLEDENQVEKYLARSTDHRGAAAILQRINAISCSVQPLAVAQQPTFRPRSLGQVISKLGRLLQIPIKDLWKPASLTRIVRHQLQDLHPVLGSLHARKVIWRLKIIVSLAGDSIFHAYPLQQIIHGLRPLITDEYCSGEAIGIIQYLLEVGQPILSQDVSFVLGTIVAIYLAMAKFLRSPQSSTTQDSDHVATVSNLHAFRLWLDNHIEVYKSESVEFGRILEAAKGVKGPVKPLIHSHEGDLLVYLIRECQSDCTLMPAKLHDLNFELLCSEFSCPDSYQEDIFGDGKTGALHMAGLWITSQRHNLHAAYYTWAAKSLGRAFAYSGRLASEIGRETRLQPYQRRFAKALDTKKLSGKYASRIAVINCLVDNLYNPKPALVGVAETALQFIILHARQSGENEYLHLCVSEALLNALTVKNQIFSDNSIVPVETDASIYDLVTGSLFMSHDSWAQNLCRQLVLKTREPFLLSLASALRTIPSFAQTCLPFVLHLSLVHMAETEDALAADTSRALQHLFMSDAPELLARKQSMLNALILLWDRQYPRERTRLDRLQWLKIDVDALVRAAEECRMFKTGMYLFESRLQVSPVATLKGRADEPDQFSPSSSSLLSIFRQIDEPDSFYGVEQSPGFGSITERMEYESDAVGSLTMQGAQLDATMMLNNSEGSNFDQIMQSLTKMNLNNLTQSLASSKTGAKNALVTDSLAKSALRLRRWDITIPSALGTSSSTVAFQTFQALSRSNHVSDMHNYLDRGICDALSLAITHSSAPIESIRAPFSALAALSSVDDLIEAARASSLEPLISLHKEHDSWMATSSVEDVNLLLAARETWHGIVSANSQLQSALHTNLTTANLFEIDAKLHSSMIYRALGSFQHALSNVVYLESKARLIKRLPAVAAQRIKLETAKVLWNRGELVPSIKILQGLVGQPQEDDSTAAGETSLPSILATLSRWSSEARLERPAEIMNTYLKPALDRLSGTTTGEDAGRVFHEFAAYCHKQLVSPDFVNEVRRSRKYRLKRADEIRALDAILKGKGTEKEKYAAKLDRHKATKWLRLDNEEYTRLKETREQLMRQSLDNYLMSLTAWDKEDHDILRFFALWLEYSTEAAANEVVTNGMDKVPAHKFVRLMNQLSSRLQDSQDPFQSALSKLVERVCREHPHHGMSFIYAGSNIQGGNDRTAQSRHSAATKIAQRLRTDRSTTAAWTALSRANDLYIGVAGLSAAEIKQGTRLKLRSFPATRRLEREVPQLAVPPITMSIPVRSDRNYEKIARVVAFRENMTIAGGLSTPKIITARASDGHNYKQLYKSGSDDLRQDAIMEQVFEQVSMLLRSQKATKQRDLGIRTYKVIALSGNAGVIEFVSNTVSLNDYLADAHARYHPADLKWSAARRRIDAVSKDSKEKRVETYHEVAQHFNPVLRHFFFEQCEDPDAWFKMRLAYTRSTAAISILGWILGLGDRHCQNILLDERTGEVVHIDLGVSFEAGRVLTIPEVVPFRLTRDVVDGFGITKTEGVFRRCCEFTLSALRVNKDAIMTLLNVLRYDPLYNWSISPLRAKKLQTEHDHDAAGAHSATSTAGARNRGTRHSGAQKQLIDEEMAIKADAAHDKNDEEEGGEADRALSVVEKKLATSLSVEATVNELIQQATDEANLAVMFCGWAAYV